ncbi:MAG: hypothetical protein ACRBFS_08305 [Aureispira sp.]
MLTQLKRFSFLVTPMLLLVVLLLRVVVYLQDRSLMIDEANLALNIVEKNGIEFFQSLEYHQYCPPIFLLLTKWSSLLFGVHEWSLKILPFLAGLMLLGLMVVSLKKLIKTPVIHWYILLVLGFSDLAIRYNTELKQYSVDAFIALLLIYKALEHKEVAWGLRQTLFWSGLGGVAVWTSMPSIFILAAIGFAFLYQQWLAFRKIPLGVVVTGAFWLINFGVYFWLILYVDARSDVLQEYHGRFFFECLPNSETAWQNNYDLLRSLLTMITDQTVVGLLLAALAIGFGMYQVIKQDKFKALLLLLPIAFTLLASNLSLYSLLPRLILFLLPIFLLIMAIGLDAVWQKMSSIPKVLVFALLLISVVNKQGYQYFWTRLEIENSKAVLAYIVENASKEDLVYVQQGAMPAFIFYNSMHANAHHLKHFYLADWNDDPAVTLREQAWNSSTFWLFFAHTPPDKKAHDLEAVRQFARPKNWQYEVIEASAYAFEKQ